MKKLHWRFGFVILMVTLVTGTLSMPAAANQGVTWDDPVRLSDLTKEAGQPAIAVDLGGVVHVVWSQYSQSGIVGEGDTIYYSALDGDKWSQPKDVIIADTDQGAQFPELTVTPNGYLHLLWSTGGITSAVMHSRVHVCCTRDIYAWSKPMVVGSPALGQHSMVSDKRGYLYVAYADVNSKDIVFSMSKDNGSSWSRTVDVTGGEQRPDEFAIYPRLAVSDSGRIHMVWNVLPWPGRLAWYANSDDDGQNWSEPLLIDSSDRSGYREGYGPIVPDIQTYGKNQVHIIWDGAPTVERNHLYSLDDGETWSQPTVLFPEITVSGRAGWNEMAFDSAGILHAVSIIGPLHANWDGLGWSLSEDIAVRNYSGLGEMVRIKVGLGNQLHVVWLDRDISPFTVWYTHGTSSANPIAAAIIATPETTSVQERTLEPTSAIALQTQTSVAPLDNTARPLTNYSPGVAVAAGIIPVILVIAVVVFVVMKKRTNV